MKQSERRNAPGRSRHGFHNGREAGRGFIPTLAIYRFAIVLLCIALTDRAAFGQNTVTREVVSGGGGTTGSPGHIVRGTLSQTGIGRLTHGNADRHDAGFWYWAYQPEVVSTVSIPEIEANVGNRITIPLQVITPQVRGTFFPRAFRARIRFNSSLLHLAAGGPACSYDLNDCVIEVTGISQNGNETIAELEAITALGNAEKTDLVIEEFEWERRAEERTVVTKRDGELRLLDVCREGDQIRLITAGGAASRLRVWPNPAGPRATLEFVSNESGPVEIRLVGMIGSEAARLVAKEIEADRIYHTEIDLSDIPSGSYMVVYRSATKTLIERLLIQH